VGGELWRDHIGERISLSLSLSFSLSLSLSLRGDPAPLLLLDSPSFFSFLFFCKEETTWPIWSRLEERRVEEGGTPPPPPPPSHHRGYSPDERMCVHGRAI